MQSALKGYGMKKLFISYSSKDREMALKIADDLVSIGHEVWIDRRGLDGGSKWASEIVAAIKRCELFLILVSYNSLSSDNVRKEVDLASEEKKPLVPVRLVNVSSIPDDFRYHLAGLQYIELFSDYGSGFKDLIKVINRTIDVKEKSLTIDTRPWSQDFGRVLLFDYDDLEDIDELLNNIYFSLSPEEPPTFTFGDVWALRDVNNGTIFRNMGTGWMRKQGLKQGDHRKLREVDIIPGMVLEVIKVK